ncbi:hypothetical protein [Polaribacter sp. M15]
MKKDILLIILIVLLNSCQNFGQLKIVADLSKNLKEVSGNEFLKSTNSIWMINDGGNKSNLYEVSKKKGKIKRVIDIDAKNKDWEDITSDDEGNLYIGDFGNNDNDRKNLRILKIKKKDLDEKDADIKTIKFEYENQEEFPPKKDQRFFDAEAFFYLNKNFYIFTKSRVDDQYGKTFLYRVPASTKGKHKAKLIGSFNNCNQNDCWFTAADISNNKKKVALLSQKNIIIFSDFKGDNFFSGKVEKIKLKHISQKEGICFKNNRTLYITDEKDGGDGCNLYELKID